VGGAAALSSERRYATRTLPHAVARKIFAAVGRGQPALLLEAGAVVAGLAFTTAGYTRERWLKPMVPRR
jgi:hypothetical protein